jgi:hypothetical protein
MKELTREVTTTEIIGYRAADGKEFRNKEECENYERTAKAVIQADFEKLVMAENNEYGLFEYFGVGCEDYRIVRITIDNMEELRQANMYSQLIKNKNLFTEEHIGKSLIVGTGWEHDACYLYGTIEELVEKFRADITGALYPEEEKVE